ncbi:MAG: hypothetical protein JW973_16500 [Bacteroidales bacterium]|nr:hypothetical protein [Bacteroidales bacterium]
MTSSKRWIDKWLACGFLLLVFIPHYAQDSVKSSLKSKANEYFMNKDYTHALPLYRELVNVYPRDSYYQYQTALCLLNSNQNLEEVIELMLNVSADKEYPLAFFYLGRAYHLFYAFDEAVKSYSHFLSLGRKSDIRKLNVQRLIEMAKNGRELTRYARMITVKNTSISPTYLLENAYVIPTHGKIIQKPDEFFTKQDQNMNFNSLMYLPENVKTNDLIYITGYNETGKRGKEIFRIKYIDGQTWSMPELLSEVINTASDEEYPFFDTHSSILYFSSEGHSSMGGYDIFKSLYDPNTGTWSKPENLGFPINSPADDFMLVTDKTGQIGQFASNRNTGPGMITLYHIHLSDDFISVNSLTTDEIRKLSVLSMPENIPGVQPEVSKMEISELNSEQDKAEPTPFSKNKYNLLIAEALSLQLKADSLARIARDQRVLIREIPDDDAKKQFISDIHSAELESKKIQYEADQKFLEARKMKNSSDTLPESDTNLVFYKEINKIKIFQYKIQDSPARTSDGLQNSSAMAAAGNHNVDVPTGNLFEILDTSPYNETNPIPPLPSGTNGLIYRIQLGVFSKPKEIETFGGLYPLYTEWLTEKNVYKYYTGSFSSSESVSTALEKVRNIGFPDAFVVAYYNATPITTEKAREIEFAGLKL